MDKKKLVIITSILLLSLMMLPEGKPTTVNGNNSIYDFQIQNCTANQNNVSCSATNIKYVCNITPSTLIDSVDFFIEGVFYTASQNTTQTDYWYYDFAKSQDFSDTTDPVSLTKEKIFDVDSGFVTAFEGVNVPRSCNVCEVSFLESCGSCNTSDQKFCSQTSTNLSCALSFNETQSCNFCTSDWQPRSGGIYDCQENNTKFVFYDDFNTCYVQTGLLSDAPPIDHNTTTACSFFSGDFNCTLDSRPFLDKKINILCNLPTSTAEFDCITYVKKNTSSNVLLQVNPEFKDLPESSLFSFGGEQETRTSFSPKGKNLNAHISNKNLQAENTFVAGVQCSTNNTVILWEQQIKPIYKDLREVTSRFVWVQNNWSGIIIGFIALLFAAGLLGILIKQTRGTA